MKIAVAQNAPVFGRVRENVDAALASLSAAGDFDVAVLPELFSTGYFFADRAELASLAEPVPGGPASQALIEFAARRGAFVCAGIAESHGGRLYNTAILAGPDGIAAKYRKAHLFDAECDLFEPGDLPFPVADCRGVAVGIMICFDWIFPEAARTLALLGARIILHPSNLVLPFCTRAMAARAVENRVFTVTVNRVGAERGRKFDGGSVVWSPGMVNLLSCPDAEGVWIVGINPAEAVSKRLTARNDLFEDRRPEMYRLSRTQ